MMLNALLTILAFKQVIAISPTNATNQGCYTPSLVQSDKYYEAQFLLTWDECIRFCNHRLTTHAGIQYVEGYSNHCYCGNDLDKHSKPITKDDPTCRHCVGSMEYCGGTETMSIYKLRGSTPLSILIAEHKTGLMQYTEGYNVTKILDAPGISCVNYIYTENEIYFSNIDNQYFRWIYGNDLQMYQDPELVESPLVYKFTLDWASSNRTYFDDSEHVFVLQGEDDSMSAIPLLEESSRERDLSVDPYNRKLFITENQRKLYSYDLVANKKSSFYINKLALKNLIVAADVQNQLLYVTGVDKRGNNRPHLFRMKYDGSQIRELYNGSELADVRAIDVFKDTVVWASYNNSLFTLYKRDFSRYHNEVVMLYQTVNPIRSVKIYHPEKQTPGVKFLCSQLGCPHSCEAVSLFEVKCSCPPGMTLALDKATCQDKIWLQI